MAKNRVVTPIKMLVIGGSAGSLDVLLEIVSGLRSGLPFTVLILLHRKSVAESALVELLADRSKLPVKDIEDKDLILPSTLFVAPPDYHLLVEEDGVFSLDASEKVNFSRPSIDVTFESAAAIYKANTAALLLSGANADGTAGLKKISDAGGLTIVQDPQSAIVPFMPTHALNKVNVQEVLLPHEMAAYINSLPGV